jgi:hypothetical protein
MDPLALGSRYAGLETGILTAPDGTEIRYLRRRFLPDLERLALLQEYVVVHGDRPDLVAARTLGDPELFWRLCDANPVLHPRELTETPGRRLRVTLPPGIPGVAE